MRYYLRREEEFLPIELSENGNGYTVIIDNQKMDVDVRHISGNRYSALVNGKSHVLYSELHTQQKALITNHIRTELRLLNERQKLEAELFGDSNENVGRGEVRAPMPGMILRVEVLEGDKVEAGQPILVMEAMKMENEIKAETMGVVTAIKIEAGQAVEKDDLLLSIGEDEG
ncbi:MAG: acetyl-CoA carboxylase biotin carboxyl carrier protein subunit [Calditrichia bacterium]